MVAKLAFEPTVEPFFLPDSYGYRPNKSALDAVGVTRQRCWKYDWVVEFDIRGLFDNISHDLLMKEVHKHTQERWVTLSIERWLKAPMQLADGTLIQRDRGTPQGGVISPVLSNLFMHYAFDVWMTREFAGMPWCRYADDGLVHCRTKQQAERLLEALKQQMAECGLELHPDKTKIVYCKDGKRKGTHANKSFDFLGYTFRARACENKSQRKVFVGFTPAVSKAALVSMRALIRKLNIRNRTELGIEDIARLLNPILRGWFQYYGRYTESALRAVWWHFNRTLSAWVQRKYRRFYRRKTKALEFLRGIMRTRPHLFVHWKLGNGVFV